MDKTNKIDRNYNWLITLLSIAVLIAFSLIYIFWHPEDSSYFGKLVINSIPSAIVILITVPVIYVLFELMGLRFFKKIINLDSSEVAKEIIESINKQRFPQLVTFQETFRNIEWKQLLED